MPSMQRIAILPRMQVSYYEPATPAYWDMKALTSKWYWRGLDWLLKKLGARYRERIPESYPLQERVIDHGGIQKMIAGSQRAIRDLWEKRATTLIVGRDEMAKLMRDAPMEAITFNVEVPLGYDREFRYMGLRVVCVPWLEGWALLPDLDK